jgi:hypothetical protein
MRTTCIYLFTLAASLLAGAAAHAEKVEQPTARCEGKVIYEGGADDGTVVRLTIPDLRVETFARLSQPSRSRRMASPHWSSLIGTGAGAEAARKQ